MELNEKDIKQLIQQSLDLAKGKPDKGDTIQKVNQNRSRNWVSVLAEQFKEQYKAEADVRVFSKYDTTHRKDFGLNELLYDIVVCRVGKIPAMRNKKELYFIKETIWQVESEFARDSRQALIDFNKLVLGSARNKLFIGPQVRDNNKLIEVLIPPAKICSGSVYVSLIPHPAKWRDTSDNVKLWSLNK